MRTLSVCETFLSIQGESSYAGSPCFFIRLAGCNLRCHYCDTQFAYGAGAPTAIATLVAQAAASPCRLVEITGGEPLQQDATPELAARLLSDTDKTVLLETNGSHDISVIPYDVVAVIDVKCPGSGEEKSFDLANLKRLRPVDEVKFVLSDRTDYEWAARFVREHDLAAGGRTVFFSPVWQTLEGGALASWIVEDGLPVRLQIQLHKVLGMK